MSNEWYKTGDAGYAEAQRVQEEQKRAFGPMRFWLDAGKSAKVTFLDTQGFYFNEHHLQINGRWGNYFTCRRDFDECPLCESGHKVGYVCAFTCIDHSEWTHAKTGTVYKNQKKLLVVRSAVINKLVRRREALQGNLTYALFLFTRDKKEEVGTGADIEYIKRLSPSDLIKFKPRDSKESDEDWLKPFNYLELFAPKSVEELRKIAGQPAPVGAEGFNPSADKAMPVPPGATAVSETSIEDLL
jgi:hypothetical protein